MRIVSLLAAVSVASAEHGDVCLSFEDALGPGDICLPHEQGLSARVNEVSMSSIALIQSSRLLQRRAPPKGWNAELDDSNSTTHASQALLAEKQPDLDVYDRAVMRRPFLLAGLCVALAVGLFYLFQAYHGMPAHNASTGKPALMRSNSPLPTTAALRSTSAASVSGPTDEVAGYQLEDSDEEQVSIFKEPIRFENLHKTFVSNLQLAICIAFWVTLFSAPVYSPRMDWLTFGEVSRTVEGQKVAVCGNGHYGAFINKGNVTHFILEKYDPKSGVIFDPRNANHVWCGYLPASYLGYWPNVAQFCIFSVYQSTGTTVQLVWQGIIGTWCAVLNLWIMTCMFPEGARMHECTLQEQTAGLCRLGMMVHDAYYVEWVCWVNVIFVLFLFLISNSAENTIKFGMSWHLYFMMNFMNPHKGPIKGEDVTIIPMVYIDGEKTVVMLTSVIGGILAILATIVPRPLLNITRVTDDSLSIVKALDDIWVCAINYFCGPSRSAKRFQIEEKISALSRTIARVEGNLSESWWETCNAGKYRQLRALFHSFDETVGQLDDVMYAMKASVLSEEFDGRHSQFTDAMKPSMQAVQTAGIELMQVCASCCRDGDVDDTDAQSIEEKILVVKEKQGEMHARYVEVLKDMSEPFVSYDLFNENLFIFALSAWARKIGDFAAGMTGHDSVQRKARGCPGALFSHLFEGFGRVWWDTKVILNREHLRFCFVNLISITLAFVLGYWLNAEIYDRYDSTMASTLALLVVHTRGSALQKNLQRLLGVALGKVIPIITMAIVGIWHCDASMRPYAHMVSIFLFFFCFCYMYYTSLQWDYVGCLIAGIACFTLLIPCNEHANFSYAQKYKEIGAVTSAIILQLFVEGLAGHKQSPRDLAVHNLRRMRKHVLSGYQAFFDGDIDRMVTEKQTMKALFDFAEELRPECDPKLEVVPLMSTPFKLKLYSRALEQLRLLLSDFQMLELALKFRAPPTRVKEEKQDSQDDKQLAAEGAVPEPEEDPAKSAAPAEVPSFFLPHGGLRELLRSKPAFKDIQEDLMNTINNCFSTLVAVLKHTTEDPIRHKGVQHLEQMVGIRNLDGADELYKQINEGNHGHDPPDPDGDEITKNKRARLTCLMTALINSANHSGTIFMLCLQENIY